MSEINGYNMIRVPLDYISRASVFTLWIKFWSCNLNLDRNEVVTFCSQECQGGALWSWPLKGWNRTSQRGGGCEHHMLFTSGQKVKRTHHPTWTDCPCQLLKLSTVTSGWRAAVLQLQLITVSLPWVCSPWAALWAGPKAAVGTELPENTDVSLQWD